MKKVDLFLTPWFLKLDNRKTVSDPLPPKGCNN